MTPAATNPDSVCAGDAAPAAAAAASDVEMKPETFPPAMSRVAVSLFCFAASMTSRVVGGRAHGTVRA